MAERKIGDTRTFEKIKGIWEIKTIYLDKNLLYTLALSQVECPKCKYKFPEPRNYLFNYIEELSDGFDTKYLGISKCGRYILLDDYIDKGIDNPKIVFDVAFAAATSIKVSL